MGEISARGCCNRRCSCNFGETTARRSSNGTVSSFRKSYEVVDVFEHRDDVNDGNGGGDGDEEEGKAKPSANLEIFLTLALARFDGPYVTRSFMPLPTRGG